jgi:UDP-N-acetylglucosamine:LPS N-acetylglucosamine transferase
LVAWFKGIPVVNIESSVRFVKASKTTRLLRPFSALTALQWEEQKKFLKGGVTVGPLLPKPEIKPWRGGYILVTGGTYGHKLLFDTISTSGLTNIILQAGRVDPQPYAEIHPEWKIITLTEKFHEILSGADVVVTHFGSTILDALVYRKPMVIVPNPEWTRTAGIEDAKHLAKKINAILVEEITLENLLAAIDIAKKTEIPRFSNGAEILANKIMELIIG